MIGRIAYRREGVTGVHSAGEVSYDCLAILPPGSMVPNILQGYWLTIPRFVLELGLGFGAGLSEQRTAIITR